MLLLISNEPSEDEDGYYKRVFQVKLILDLLDGIVFQRCFSMLVHAYFNT